MTTKNLFEKSACHPDQSAYRRSVEGSLANASSDKLRDSSIRQLSDFETTTFQTSSKQILVLSPHLDDAVLSCADHIISWISQGYDVTVITIFTSFKSTHLSTFAKQYINSSGFSNITSFERARKKEDIQAMNALGVKWQHLNFIDAAFRENNNKSLYSQIGLFLGKISPYDLPLSNRLRNNFKRLTNFDSVLIPLSIGKHADHILTRLFADNYFSNYKKWYYVDWPYAKKWFNWSLPQIIKVISCKKSVIFMSHAKKELLKLYVSQYPLLFNKKPSFPEIILYER